MTLPSAFDRLRDERMWVAWADEDGRKVPKSPRGGNARSNDPSTWGTYDEADAARARHGYTGVGLMLTDGYIGIDLDGAVEDGEIVDWAQAIVDEFGSYAEFSPSGAGIHVIAWADPEQVGPVGRADHAAGIEIYNHGRYFTVTGEQVGFASIVDATQDVASFVERHFHGESPEQAVRRRIGNLARDQVKRRANRTMAENCARDGIRYARVPMGGETCGFCIMLASRGFAYTTPEAASHAHDGCDCKVMPGFDGMEVEGYDPDSMYEIYAEARSRAEHPTDREISREIERIISGEPVPGAKRSVGAAFSDVYAARNREVAKADLSRIKQTQLVHVEGTPQNRNAAAARGMEPSCFTVGVDEIRGLIRTHAGHGVPDMAESGEWHRKENCTADHIVGYIINRDGEKVPTRCFKIHYANDGVHAVPRYDDGGEPDDVG